MREPIADMGEVSEIQELIAKLRKRREFHLGEVSRIDMSLAELGEKPLEINPAYAHFPKPKYAVNFYLSQHGNSANLGKMLDDLVEFGVGASKLLHRGGARSLIEKSITQLVDMGLLVREGDTIRLP